jgi:L-fuconolactonase
MGMLYAWGSWRNGGPLLLMRIDAHQHFWRYSSEEYGWISEAMPAIRRDFLPGDLKPLLDAAGFQASVVVQARQTLEETRWLLELADANAHVAGVVGWVELCSRDVLGQLEDFAANPKFAGVRHVLQDEPDDAFMLREDFRAGLGLLNGFGLAYDLLLHPRHLPVAAKLVAEFPEQRFVLDHLAKPFIADRIIAPWREDLKALAYFPNVCCKLSGMVTEAKWGAWTDADFAPYLDAALEAFGAERLMIGSDWPVCLLSGDYGATMGIVMEYLRKLSEAEQAAILGGNCARFYRLKV